MMRHLVHRLGLLAMTVVIGLLGCGNSLDKSAMESSPAPDVAQLTLPSASTNAFDLPAQAAGDNERHPPEYHALQTVVRDDPEEKTLDQVSLALVDPDESVRAQAQVLWEATLARQ